MSDMKVSDDLAERLRKMHNYSSVILDLLHDRELWRADQRELQAARDTLAKLGYTYDDTNWVLPLGADHKPWFYDRLVRPCVPADITWGEIIFSPKGIKPVVACVVRTDPHPTEGYVIVQEGSGPNLFDGVTTREPVAELVRQGWRVYRNEWRARSETDAAKPTEGAADALGVPEQPTKIWMCSARLLIDGKPAPRTCSQCGLGPCKYGLKYEPQSSQPLANFSSGAARAINSPDPVIKLPPPPPASPSPGVERMVKGG